MSWWFWRRKFLKIVKIYHISLEIGMILCLKLLEFLLFKDALEKIFFFLVKLQKVCKCTYKLHSQTHTRTERHRQTDGRTDGQTPELNFQFRGTCRAQFVLHAYLSIYVSFNCSYAKHIDACNSTLCKIKTCIDALLTQIVLVLGT